MVDSLLLEDCQMFQRQADTQRTEMKCFMQNHKTITTTKVRKDAGVLNVDFVGWGLGLFSHTGVLLYPSKKNKSHTTRHKELDERGGKKSHSLSLLTSNKVISFQYLALKTIFSYVNLPSFFSDSFGSLKDKAGDFPRFSYCQQISRADPNQQRIDPTYKHCVCLQSPIHLIPLSRRPPLLSKN